MQIKNPLNKKSKVPPVKSIEKSKEKKDWFEVSIIVFTGTMIGALTVYLLIQFT